MRFTVTPYDDDRGTPGPPESVDLPTLRAVLAEAAVTGRRLHIRPRPRPERAPTPTQESR
ncbi:hypothetical protein [Kitasatospora sp. NPDC086791]|uniref:hypothetical protein n=1 Tax=Kitasatospora sp. NPDC086791 TaxID=3155178 RepID=UPI0034343B72